MVLGALIPITLLFAMLSNLSLLPTLPLSLERNIANKETMKKPAIENLSNDDEENIE